jgi:capsular polysaccharide biosynthesis protein
MRFSASGLFYRLAKYYYHFSTLLAIKLLEIGLYLNPRKKHISDMLIDLRGKVQTHDTLRKIKFNNILSYCRKIQGSILYITEAEIITLTNPRIVNTTDRTNYYVGEVKLPQTYLVQLDNCLVFAQTDLIIHNNTALYDEINNKEKYKYGIKSSVIHKVQSTSLHLRIHKSIIHINEGIHLLKDHSGNYYHWLLENISRLLMLRNIDNKIPLLISDELPDQFYEILSSLNLNNAPIIKLIPQLTYNVEKLYYPSSLSTVHDNYATPRYDADVLISKKAINYVRSNITQIYNINYTTAPYRKIFICRKKSTYRSLLNTDQIENYLISCGFEILFLEHLTFESQVKIFSQAKVIIGQSGAGLTNAIFSHIETKLLILVNDSPNSNLQIFNFIESILGIKTDYILGNSNKNIYMRNIHDDFIVDLNLIQNWLGKL